MFEQKQILEDDYSNLIKDLRRDSQDGVSLDLKLNRLAHNLKIWAKDDISSLQSKIKNTRAQICLLEESRVGLRHYETINNLKATLEKLSYKEEIHWHQRARNLWLSAVDRNTSYFHKSALERRKRNFISSLKNERGTFTSNQ